jgi:hypothetical protein
MNEDTRTSKVQFPWQRTAGMLIVALLGAGVFASWTHAPRDVPRPAVTSPATPRVSPKRCAECHPDIAQTFHTAPHARTLRRATDAAVLGRFAGRSFHRRDSNVEYHYRQREGQLFVSTSAYARDLPITWVFGSGSHAQTPVITWTDKKGKITAIEHAVSWYPPGRLGVTLDRDKWNAPSGIEAIGRHWGPAETVNCFGCHSTFVPTRGRQIAFDRIQPNISCVRCHWDTQGHVDEMEQGKPATIERFSRMTPRESVDRCGECHRRADEVGGPITPDLKMIVRFAPVGLVQSPCFKKQREVVLDSGQPARMDCTTCHDPHSPASRDWHFYRNKCLSCHDAAHNRAADCSVATSRDNCLKCHMPKVSMSRHLKFTDHWIRIRHDKRATPASK